jgi:hypothetical protein
MQCEGTLHIVRLNHGHTGDPKFNVGFSDYAAPTVATTHREIVTEDALRKFLIDQVKVHPDSVSVTFKHPKLEGRSAIFHLQLTDEELLALDLK